MASPDIGKIGWIDITVDDATGLKDFYASVVGWQPDAVELGDYSDFNMTLPGSGEAAVGICHARGSNEALPRQWLIYIVVENAAESARICSENGGKVLVEPRSMGGAVICVIEDPAGAVSALYQQSPDEKGENQG